MKILVTILFLVTLFTGYDQQRQPNVVYGNLSVPYRPIDIDLITDTGRLYSFQINNSFKITFKELTEGYYKFRYSDHGKTIETIKPIFISKNQLLELDVKVEGPC